MGNNEHGLQFGRSTLDVTLECRKSKKDSECKAMTLWDLEPPNPCNNSSRSTNMSG